MDLNALQSKFNAVFQSKPEPVETEGNQLPAQIIDEVIVEGGSRDSKELLELLSAEYNEHKAIVDSKTEMYTKYSMDALKDVDSQLNMLYVTDGKNADMYSYIKYRVKQMLDLRKDIEEDFSVI